MSDDPEALFGLGQRGVPYLRWLRTIHVELFGKQSDHTLQRHPTGWEVDSFKGAIGGQNFVLEELSVDLDMS